MKKIAKILDRIKPMIETFTLRYESEELGNLIGLELSQRYNMPYGLSEKVLYMIYDHSTEAEWAEVSVDLTIKLLELNPSLYELYRRTYGMRGGNAYFILLGSISRYTIDDIEFFLSATPMNLYGTFRINGKIDQEYTDKRLVIESIIRDKFKVDDPLNYQISYKNLDKIYNHLKTE